MTTHAHQITAVAIKGRALLIDGKPGTGKSTLALSLIDRGAELIGDDSVIVEKNADNLIVRPHPNTRGLMEIRNLGLITFPVRMQATASLIITLTPDAPRFIVEANSVILHGVQLPEIAMCSASSNLALKAEIALKHYGKSES